MLDGVLDRHLQSGAFLRLPDRHAHCIGLQVQQGLLVQLDLSFGRRDDGHFVQAFILEKVNSLLKLLNLLHMVPFEHLHDTELLAVFARIVGDEDAVVMVGVLRIHVLQWDHPLHCLVVEVLEDGERGVVDHDAVWDPGLVHELLQVVHNEVEVLFQHDAPFIAPGLVRKLDGLHDHSVLLRF